MRALRKARGSQLLAFASVMRSTAPPLQKSWPRRLPVGPRCPNHRPEDPLVVLRGRPSPRGHLLVPAIPPEQHGIEGPVPHPPGGPGAGPAQPAVHLHHQGEGLRPEGGLDRVPVPVPGRGSLCPPRRPPLRPLRPRRGAASPPSAAEAAAIRAGSALGVGAAGWCWGQGGFGGMRSPASGSML